MKLRSLCFSALALTITAAFNLIPGHAQGAAISVVHAFTGTDGAQPSAALVPGPDGAFYGTALRGGANDNGTVFRVALNGTLIVLHDFGATDSGAANDDGSRPYAGLVDGQDGFFYGVTEEGGSRGVGVVFRISPAGDYAVIAPFDYDNTGGQPHATLALGSDGNLYGTATTDGQDGVGTVYVVTRDGALTALASFFPDRGEDPDGALVEAQPGVFYGTTSLGGANNDGTVFKINADGSSGIVVVHTFSATGSNSVNDDGARPVSSLAIGPDGLLIGTTPSGGSNGLGTIFGVGSNDVLVPLFSFASDGMGKEPFAGVTAASDGNFYGVTGTGAGDGTVFQLSAERGYTALDSLDFRTTGATAYGNLVDGNDGYLYGTASAGGSNGHGTIYRIPLPGPVVTVEATVPTVDSGTGDAGEFTVSIPAPVDRDILVYYRIKGSAVAGVDYQPLKGKVRIKAGKTQKRIQIITKHQVSTYKKIVKLVLTPADTYTVGSTGPAKVKVESLE